MQAFPAPRRTALGCTIALILCAATPALAGDPPGPVNGSPPLPVYGSPPVPVYVPPPGPPALGPAPQGGYMGWVVPVPVMDSEAQAQYKKRKRLIIAGASIFGLAYYGALTAGSIGVSRNNRGSREWAAALFPIGGPFVAAGLRAEPNKPQEADLAGTGLMIALGATQVLGAGLFFLGITSPHGRDKDPCAEHRLAGSPPCRPSLQPQISMQPIVTPHFAGAGLTGSF